MLPLKHARKSGKLQSHHLGIPSTHTHILLVIVIVAIITIVIVRVIVIEIVIVMVCVMVIVIVIVIDTHTHDLLDGGHSFRNLHAGESHVYRKDTSETVAGAVGPAVRKILHRLNHVVCT